MKKDNEIRSSGAVSLSGRGTKGEALPEYNLYNPKLKTKAHRLRYEMTKDEACLWKYALRAGIMKGYNFNRQRPVLKYIADFMCKKLNLIIEVDGISHSFENAHERDQERQKKLETAGFTVLRFTDAEILTQIDRVKQIIYNTVEKLEAGISKVLPLPPPGGGQIQD